MSHFQSIYIRDLEKQTFLRTGLIWFITLVIPLATHKNTDQGVHLRRQTPYSGQGMHGRPVSRTLSARESAGP